MPPQAGNRTLPAPTAKTSTYVPPPADLGIGAKLRDGYKYTGPGVGPTGVANVAAINGVKSMLQGKPMKKGGSVKASSASKRADGCAVKGKTRGKIV